MNDVSKRGADDDNENRAKRRNGPTRPPPVAMDVSAPEPAAMEHRWDQSDLVRRQAEDHANIIKLNDYTSRVESGDCQLGDFRKLQDYVIKVESGSVKRDEQIQMLMNQLSNQMGIQSKIIDQETKPQCLFEKIKDTVDLRLDEKWTDWVLIIQLALLLYALTTLQTTSDKMVETTTLSRKPQRRIGSGETQSKLTLEI